jgi:hypothetical protein
VNIRFISSMTSDDEDRLAPAVLIAVSSLLDQLSLAYTLRIETTGDKIFHHSHPASTLEREGLPAVHAVRSAV